MPTLDISVLAATVRTNAAHLIENDDRVTNLRSRPFGSLAAELSAVAERCPDAVAEAADLLKIAASQPLTEELCDVIARAAAALFLGRRLLESNGAAIIEQEPLNEQALAPTFALATVLDQMSLKLLAVLDRANHSDQEAVSAA